MREKDVMIQDKVADVPEKDFMIHEEVETVNESTEKRMPRISRSKPVPKHNSDNRFSHKLISNEFDSLHKAIDLFTRPPPENVSIRQAVSTATARGALEVYDKGEKHILINEIIRLISAIKYSTLFAELGRSGQLSLARNSNLTPKQHEKMLLLGRRGAEMVTPFGFAGFGLVTKFSCDAIKRFRLVEWYSLLKQLANKDNSKLQELKAVQFHPNWFQEVQVVGWTIPISQTEEAEVIENLDESVHTPVDEESVVSHPAKRRSKASNGGHKKRKVPVTRA